MSITVSGSNWGNSVASREVSSLQSDLKQVAKDLASGKAAPRERVATAAIVGLRHAEVSSILESLGRTSNILSEATNSLQGMLTQYQNAYGVAEQVASDTATTDEIVILQSTFVQLMNAADAAAKNADFMGLKLLNTTNGTQATALAAQAGSASAAVADMATGAVSFAVTDETDIAVNGNIFGTVQSVDVETVVTGTFKIEVKMIDTESGLTYSLKNDAETPVVSGNMTLRSTLDESTVTMPYAVAITSVDTAAEMKASLEALFQLDVQAAATSFTPDIGLKDADIAFDVTGATEGSGTYRFTQSSEDLTQITVIAPTGKTETVTIAANGSGADQTSYAMGVKITAATGWTAATDLSDSNGARTLGVTLNAGTDGFQKVVGVGSESITITIKDQSKAALGLDTLSVDSVANAQIAADTLDTSIKQIASVLGNLKAVGERVSATADNLQNTAAVVADVMASIVDVDLLDASERLAELNLQQMQAMEAFVGTLTHRKQVMAALNRSLS